MSTYVVGRYEVTDEAAYQQYRALAGPLHTAHGGTLVAKGSEVEQLEGGDRLTNFVLLEFPTADAARAWFESPEYEQAKAARSRAGTMTLSIVEG